MNFGQVFSGIESNWDGKTAISEMKKFDYNWKQMEWIGFYFQLLVKRAGAQHGFKMPGRRLISGDFDATFNGFDWDLKAHSTQNADGKPQFVSILNDIAAIDVALLEKGRVFIAVAEGKAIYDVDGTFHAWHEALKGPASRYVLEGQATGRRSRVRKSGFTLEAIKVYELESTKDLGFMNQGRNSNGRPRPAKYTLDSRVLSATRTFTRGIDF